MLVFLTMSFNYDAASIFLNITAIAVRSFKQGNALIRLGNFTEVCRRRWKLQKNGA